MAKSFFSLSTAEASAFLKEQGNIRTGVHHMTGTIGKPAMPWKYCTNCGLLALKNVVTLKQLRKACRWIED